MQITLGRKLFIYTSALLLTVVLMTFMVLERNQARQWREYLQVQQLAFARFATPELLKHFRGNFSDATAFILQLFSSFQSLFSRSSEGMEYEIR